MKLADKKWEPMGSGFLQGSNVVVEGILFLKVRNLLAMLTRILFPKKREFPGFYVNNFRYV